MVQLNNMLKTSKWMYQWKRSFYPDVSKQAQKVVFSSKRHELSHPPVVFSNVPVKGSSIQKHLRIHFD